MAKLTDNQLTYIRDLVVKGRNLCHKESCDERGLCPMTCGCGMQLDLHTALPWTVTDKLAYILRKKSVPFTKLRALTYSLALIVDAVKLHRDRYERLFDYLVEVHAALRILEKELRPRTCY